ncbi:hypothetical protein [Haloarcula sp. JP-L23]|nr:hypothetical protein G9465_08670 [Haloarcula sp. JP-L23]
MAYQTTLGWSLVSSGIVTLVLGSCPVGPPVGLVLLALGVLTLYVRQ